MSSRSVWILLVLVLALCGAVLWQQGRERDPGLQAERPLFDGVRPDRVQSVHIDHLERSLQLTITRDANGRWQIVDPLSFPAETGVLDRLLEVVSKNRAILVDKPDLVGLSLSPPRAVLELTEVLPEGERKLRLELGEKALDGKHVYARVDGQVVSTLLNLDSTLDRDLPDWRQRRILDVDPAMVVELRRSGKFALEPGGAEVDLAFAAGTTETGWRSSLPWNAALDPGAVDSLLSNLCYLKARTFLADSALQIPPLGLDHPDLRFELSLASGSEVREEVLLLKRHPESESWLCMKQGSTHAFRVDQIDGVYLSVPTEGFLDSRLVRAESDKVERIELTNGAETLTLRRNGQIWMLGAPSRSEVAADTTAVTDLLAALAQARAARFLIDAAERVAFSQAAPLGLRLFTQDAELGCDFGALHEASPGVAGRLFRRVGDDVVGVVEEKTAALATKSWTDFVERQLIKLPERAIARIELTHAGATHAYVRNAETGRWSPEGVDAEAPKAFLKCVERLLSLRADVAVALDAPFAFADTWQVVVVDGGGVHTAYRVGSLASDPTQRGFDDGRVRGLVTSSGLYEDLGRIP